MPKTTLTTYQNLAQSYLAELERQAYERTNNSLAISDLKAQLAVLEKKEANMELDREDTLAQFRATMAVIHGMEDAQVKRQRMDFLNDIE